MLERTNQEWLDDLGGTRGAGPQRAAHEDLGRYLYVVAYNYLRLREGDVPALAGFAREELAALAQDFVQETLEKLAANGFARLASFRGAGSFRGWVAQIVRNQAAQELRKSYWTRRAPSLPDAERTDDDAAQPSALLLAPDEACDANPERHAVYRQVCETLQCCLDALSERYRLAVLNCLGDGIAAESVASALNTTANAVYLMVHRGKRQLKECLLRAGVGPEALAALGR